MKSFHFVMYILFVYRIGAKVPVFSATGPLLFITVPTHGTRASTIAVTSSSSVGPAVATSTKGSNDVQILIPLLAGTACAVVLHEFHWLSKIV